MKRTLVVRDELRDLIRHLPPHLKKKIKQALEEIVEDPLCGKPLREELLGLQSYQIGTVRIIYRAQESTLTLITIGPRKTVYQKAALELKNRHV